VSRRFLMALGGLTLAIVGTGIAVSALAFGSGGRITRSLGVTPLQFAHVAPTQTPISGQNALDVALDGLSGSSIASARLGDAPEGAGWDGFPWFYATVRVPSLKDGATIEPLWEADLVEGAVADRSGDSNDIHQQFGGSSFTLLLPNGEQIPEEGGLGNVQRGQVYSDQSDDDIRASVTQVLDRFSLTPVSIKVYRAWQPAVAVVASTDDVSQAAKRYLDLTSALFGDPPTYEGWYLELRDDSGTPFLRASQALRVAAGRIWIDPQWRSDVPVVSGGRPPVGGG
jgi:hypothetical protein